MKVSILFLISMIACVVQSQYYYPYPYYYPSYYYYPYQQLYSQNPYYNNQFQFPSLFFPASPASTTPPSTSVRFGIFPEGFVNLDLIGSSGFSRGVRIGRGLGNLIQLIVGAIGK